MTKIYNYSVINKYLIVGKHLLTTFLVILKPLKGTIKIVLFCGPEFFENIKLVRNGCFRSGGIFFNESGHISVIYELGQIKKLFFIDSVMTNRIQGTTGHNH
jgi:hypothetical protein